MLTPACPSCKASLKVTLSPCVLKKLAESSDQVMLFPRSACGKSHAHHLSECQPARLIVSSLGLLQISFPASSLRFSWSQNKHT